MATSRYLALELAGTIRHDGNGGVADELTSVDGLASWVAAQEELLAAEGFAAAGIGAAATAAGSAARFDVDADVDMDADVDVRFDVDEASWTQVLAVRAALRALLARAVSPAPPSRADADRLPPADQALARLNTVAAHCPVVPRLHWPADTEPVARLHPASPSSPAGLPAALARAAIAFLSSPDLPRLRACTAPRCVRYFLKEHGRQEFCKASCSNRARAARHYQRHHAAPAAD
ncbi:CGNR zinc finger domain-containing protein [Kitasatospora sp. NPDC096077]|uniref:CGNR zinc finger domain-containing protein n=1 Tax=Kitasatospora sp. NPDC096077 TaxID=3155544 RepID=UPI00332F438E